MPLRTLWPFWSNGTPYIFITAAGTFTTNHTVRINDVMLPCLLQNHTFTINLMVIPWECSIEMTYGVIVEQESMQRLNLDTSICK